jgi:hypothetical protein
VRSGVEMSIMPDTTILATGAHDQTHQRARDRALPYVWVHPGDDRWGRFRCLCRRRHPSKACIRTRRIATQNDPAMMIHGLVLKARLTTGHLRIIQRTCERVQKRR